MAKNIETGFMAFIKDGSEGIGAIRDVATDMLTIYVENAGEFEVPRAAVRDVHSNKVMLNPGLLPRALLKAIGHVHDREDPNVAG